MTSLAFSERSSAEHYGKVALNLLPEWLLIRRSKLQSVLVITCMRQLHTWLACGEAEQIPTFQADMPLLSLSWRTTTCRHNCKVPAGADRPLDCH